MGGEQMMLEWKAKTNNNNNNTINTENILQNKMK